MYRILDFIIFVIILPFYLTLFLIIYLLVLIFQGKPVFFKQIRLGKNMKEFYVYKFRTMIIGAQDQGTKLNSYEDDYRITKLGKILRTLSLDELPQLINIFIGDMSFVGPRPPVKGELDLEYNLPDNWQFRFKVRPGLTGWAQINGRDSLSWFEKITYDLEFINLSRFKRFILYIFIVFYTPFYLTNFKNTYEKKAN
jgi:undecaprenyl phosphate N,N'-diacetylbacillosamine 1-phosphate transferase